MLIDVTDKSIDELGERMVPSYHKGALVYGEHIVRYEGVLPLLRGKTVLDIASGSGYGSYIMASEAKHVTGVDVDPGSVAYAERNYTRKNIEFKVGDAEEIPIEDASVDVVVTFETVEHIKNYKKFISEIKRVLKPGGFAIISTPNDLEFPEGNHFHLHEFTHDELQAVLKNYFKYTKFSYQYTWLYTAILNGDKAGKEWDSQLETFNVAPLTKDKAIYFTAICSDEDIAKLELKELGAISEHWSARSQQAKHKEVEAMAVRKAEIEALLEKTEGELRKVYGSRGWRALSVFYRFEGRLRKVLRRKSA
jgi:ubiquinone/menaquinone biosynthesis C-methylase UbiE